MTYTITRDRVAQGDLTYLPADVMRMESFDYALIRGYYTMGSGVCWALRDDQHLTPAPDPAYLLLKRADGSTVVRVARDRIAGIVVKNEAQEILPKLETLPDWDQPAQTT